MDLHGTRVVVVGLAGSGRAAARLAVERGAEVIGVDRDPDLPPPEGLSEVRLELGPHRVETFLGADLIVVSPGVPATLPELVAARDAGVVVLGELHFAALFLDLPVVAVTGTNGKSTVTHFTGQLLAAAGHLPFVGGNYGRPYSEAALREHAGAYDLAVLEVSSYQMEWPGRELRPHAAVVMNLTPDHLARHGTMEAYGELKCRLFAHMLPDDLAIVPADDPLLIRLADEVGGGTRAYLGALPGVVRDGRLAAIRLPAGTARAQAGPVATTLDLTAFSVPGEHNRDNAALAGLLAIAMGASPEVVQHAIGSLQALPHRMEVVAEQGGVTWINDSKATNVAATRVGLAGLSRKGVVLLGGEAKGDAFADLVPVLEGWQVICFGGSGDRIAQELEASGVRVERVGLLADAVSRARALAGPGELVLLSPGCASFDEFRNFEHRGLVFRILANGGTP